MKLIIDGNILIEEEMNYRSNKNIFLLTLLFILNFSLFYIPGFPGSISKITAQSPDAQIPDMRLTYSGDDLYSFLTEIGAEGRQAYQMMHLTIDLCFPLIYGLLLFAILSRMVRKREWRHKCLPFLGFLPTISDLIENFSLVYITSNYPNHFGVLIEIIHASTLVKFISLTLLVLMILYHLITRSLRVLLSRQSK